MIDWPEDEPVPRPYVGAVLLLYSSEGENPFPLVVHEVLDGGAVSGMSAVNGFWMLQISVDPAHSEWAWYPKWEWPPEQLDIFRRLYRPERPELLMPDRAIRVERD